ncbi:PAS domain-containing sensor histidine kinase [Nibrella viscosa]|uniref:PAS domain-containing sensor histidine kinase n=1 Tax=Nibrella viscosa TaxID=1084524 RepID=UPI0031F127D4
MANRPQSDSLQRILDSSVGYILLWEPVRDEAETIIDFRLTLYNPRILETFAISPEVLVSHTLRQIHMVTDEIFANYVRVIETGTPYRAERAYDYNGNTRWHDITATKLNDGLLTIVKDITDTKQVSLALQTQSQLLKQVFDSSLNGIYLLQAVRDATGAVVDYRVTQCNRVAQQELLTQFGIDPLNRTLLEIYPASKDQGLFTIYKDVLQTGKPHQSERHYPLQNLWYEISAVKMDNDSLVITFVNTTATRLTARQAIRQAERVEGLLNGSINGMIAMEPVRKGSTVQDFRFTMANQMAVQMCRIPLEQLIGGSLNTLFPSAKSFKLLDLYVSVLETGQPQRTQFFYNVDGYQAWYDLAISRMDSDTLVLSYTDITESRVMQQRLEQMVEELKRSNEYLEQFAYIASHDLQEPLRKIEAFSNLLTQHYAASLDNTARDYLSRLSKSSVRLQTFVRSLLAYSRLTIGNEQIRNVPLNRILAEVLLDLNEAVLEKQAQISISALPIVQGNATQLQQLFRNLISNALKFQQHGTAPVIQISARTVDAKDLPNAPIAQRRGQWVVIDITDNGIGFEEKHHDRIFQLFQRLHGRNQYEGTGIGLALCKKVAELHGGAISAHSTPGEGSTFTVYLPYEES